MDDSETGFQGDETRVSCIHRVCLQRNYIIRARFEEEYVEIAKSDNVVHTRTRALSLFFCAALSSMQYDIVWAESAIAGIDSTLLERNTAIARSMNLFFIALYLSKYIQKSSRLPHRIHSSEKSYIWIRTTVISTTTTTTKPYNTLGFRNIIILERIYSKALA